MAMAYNLGICFILIGCLVTSINCDSTETGSDTKPEVNCANLYDAVTSRSLDDIEKCKDDSSGLYIANGGMLSPMHRAIQLGYSDMIYALLENGFDLNKAFARPTSVIYYAADNSSQEIFELLLTLGANVNAMDIRGLTPLLEAKMANRRDIADLLSRHGARSHLTLADRQTSLHRAARVGALMVAAQLIKEGVDVDAKDDQGNTPLYEAVANSRTAVVNLLLFKGAKGSTLTSEGQTYLDVAIANKHKPSLRALLENRVPATLLNAKGMPALLTAAQFNDDISAQLLVDYGLDPNAVYTDKKRNVLHLATLEGYSESLLWLVIELNIDINSRDYKQATALHLVADDHFKGDKDVVVALLTLNICLDCKDENGNTALYYIKSKEYLKEIADYLKEECKRKNVLCN